MIIIFTFIVAVFIAILIWILIKDIDSKLADINERVDASNSILDLNNLLIETHELYKFSGGNYRYNDFIDTFTKIKSKIESL